MDFFASVMNLRTICWTFNQICGFLQIWPEFKFLQIWSMFNFLQIWSEFKFLQIWSMFKFLLSYWSAAASVGPKAGRSSRNVLEPASENMVGMNIKCEEYWSIFLVIVILAPTVASRSHWTIAMQVSRSPFKMRENLRRLLTHLRIKTGDTP